eukprot:511739-Pelagomonas_calceolata.AAC.2
MHAMQQACGCCKHCTDEMHILIPLHSLRWLRQLALFLLWAWPLLVMLCHSCAGVGFDVYLSATRLYNAQVGTSTGAIIAVSMAVLRMDLDQVEAIYTKLGQKVRGTRCFAFGVFAMLFAERSKSPCA